MRRLVIACAACALLMMIETAACFALALDIEKSYPHDGSTGLSPVNCAVKVYFNQDISDPANSAANSECFTLTGPDGKELEVKVINDTKSNNMVLVVVSQDLEQDTKYKLTISGDFVATSGELLETDKTITFSTRNQANDTKVSMIMMVCMLVFVIFFSTKVMKKQADKDAAEKEKEKKVNPYKVSKKTGKSVEAIVAKTEKEKQKKAAEEAKLKGDRKKIDYDDDEDEYEYVLNDNYRVSGPRPISAAGSTYLSGKKAKAEAAAKKKAAVKAAGTTRPKKQTGKSKNKKKK